MKVFWAWQSDLDETVCRHFIKAALIDAIKQVAADSDLDERPEIDHDTKDQSGMPDIVDSILEKIAAASALVADLTTVGRTKQRKALANPNVLIELGYAKRAIGTERLIGVANSHWYKGPQDLPFDLRNRRGPITYLLPPTADAAQRKAERVKLANAFKVALRPILESANEERRKSPQPVDTNWFNEERAMAVAEMSKTSHTAQMEIQFVPHFPLRKSQRELVDAMRQSQISTFGWPIGVVVDQSPHQPKPFDDGVRAQIVIDKDTGFGTSFDYWAIKSNGSFFLLQSLFEDKSTAAAAIFFNTRIVRVTEALLFGAALYSNLGAPPDAKFTATVTHRNFSGRSLMGIGNRQIRPASTSANQSKSEVTLAIGRVDDELPKAVEALLAPMFVLFEFTEFNGAIYSDIVGRFQRGETS